VTRRPGKSKHSHFLSLFREPERLQLELTSEPFPVTHDVPSSGIVSPFEVSVKSGVAQSDPKPPGQVR